MIRYFQICALALIIPFSVFAETWVRGSVIVHSVDGSAVFSELGVAPYDVVSEKAPIQLGGLFSCRVDDQSSVFFSTSNRMFVQYQGMGSFSVERFDQAEPRPEQWKSEDAEVGQSRTIYYLRNGTIAIDSRSMAETSQCMIELPLGRVSLKRALIGIQIEYDPRGEIFSFVLACIDGQMRFTDNRGQTYTLRRGQRLAGAGSRMTPSVEVGEMSADWSGRMENFQEMIEEYREPADLLSAYQPHFQVINRSDFAATSTPQSNVTLSTRRPIVIERAREPAPVTPFRGEIPPPSAYQADIF